MPEDRRLVKDEAFTAQQALAYKASPFNPWRCQDK
jgi:hypothetical protein